MTSVSLILSISDLQRLTATVHGAVALGDFGGLPDSARCVQMDFPVVPSPDGHPVPLIHLHEARVFPCAPLRTIDQSYADRACGRDLPSSKA